MISIIVPIYNAERYLRACLDSLIGQTEKDLQILLVDDASTDSSPAIAKQYAAQDSRITLLSQPHAGQSAARNLGMAHATGDYIAFVDADDALEPDWCERHLAAIEGVDYVQSGYKRVQPSAISCQPSAISCQPSAISCQQLPKNRYQFTSPCMRLYRREAIAGLRFKEGVIYEDVRFSTDLWLRGATCRMIPYGGYLYTLNPASTTATRHPEDEQQLITSLRQKRHGQTLRNRLIINYTIIRLKIHFLRS